MGSALKFWVLSASTAAPPAVWITPVPETGTAPLRVGRTSPKPCRLSKGSGVLMSVLKEMLAEEGLEIKITSLCAPEPEKCLGLISPDATVKV